MKLPKHRCVLVYGKKFNEYVDAIEHMCDVGVITEAEAENADSFGYIDGFDWVPYDGENPYNGGVLGIELNPSELDDETVLVDCEIISSLIRDVCDFHYIIVNY